MQERKTEQKNNLLCFAFFSLVLIAQCSIGIINGEYIIPIIRNCVYCVLFGSVYIFSFFRHRQGGQLNYDNSEHFKRFILVSSISLVYIATLSFVNPSLWPLVPVAVYISLMSDALVGILGYTFIMLNLLMFSNVNIWFFCLYLITGFVAIFLFDGWKKGFSPTKPFIIIFGLLFSLESVSIWLYADIDKLIYIIIPCILNCLLNWLMLLGLIRHFNEKHLVDENDQYMDINDQTYSLLVKYREDSEEDYFRAIHTAHFVDRMISAIGGDKSAARSAAYYFRFGLVYSKLGRTGNDPGNYMLQLFKAHRFPKKACEVIEELCARKLYSKESGVVYLADYFVKSITFLMQQKPDSKPDWDGCVAYVFDNSVDDNIFEQCGITVGELKLCMNIMKKEKMYYEFLSRK